MTSKKLAFAMLVATCIGTSFSLASAQAKPAAAAAKTEVAKLQIELDTTGIAKTTKVSIVPKDPYSPDDTISLSGSPMHVRIIFDGKNMKYGDNSFNEPHLLIYPVDQYAAVFPKNKQAEFNKIISDLKKIVATKSSKGFQSMPILPSSDGYEFLHVQENYLNFNHGAGSGVSYISVYGNGDPPVNESDFFYTFQGITRDNKYYVSFFWPIKVTGMPKDLPLAKSKAYAEKLARAKFAPGLDVLDKVVSSITLK